MRATNDDEDSSSSSSASSNDIKNNDNMEEKLNQVKSMLLETKKQCEELTKRLEQSTEELVLREKEQDRLYTELETQLKLNDDLQQQLRDQEECAKEHQHEQQEANNKIADLYNEISLRDLELKQLKTEMDQRLAHEVALQKDLVHQKQVYSKQRERNETLLHTNKTLTDMLEVQREQSRALEDKVRTLSEQVTRYQKQQQQEQQQQQHEEEKSSKIEELRKARQEKQDKAQQILTNQTQQSRDEVCKLSRELHNQQEEVARMQGEMDQMKAETAQNLSSMRDQYQRLQEEQKAEYETRQSHLRKKLQDKETEYQQLLGRFQELQSSVEQQQKQQSSSVTGSIDVGPSPATADKSGRSPKRRTAALEQQGAVARSPPRDVPGLQDILSSEVSFLFGL